MDTPEDAANASDGGGARNDGISDRIVLAGEEVVVWDEPREVTLRTSPGEDANAAQLARIDTEESRRYADALSIDQDLRFAADAFGSLLDEEANPTGSVTARSLLVAGLVAYARCFASGVRGGYSVDLQRIDGIINGADAYHRWLLDVRNKHIAHSVNAYEQNVPTIVLSARDSGDRRILGSMYLRATLGGFARNDYEQAIWFITQVRGLVGSDLVVLERAMVAAAEALPIDELYVAPSPTMLMVGGDQAGRRRR
jgi:hypothetical protein